jgi:hypothetical protein
LPDQVALELAFIPTISSSRQSSSHKKKNTTILRFNIFAMTYYHPSPPMFEMALRQYLAKFDGKPKSFSEDVEPLFDQLYQDELYLEHENGPLSRKKTKAYHAQVLAAG